MRSFNFSADFDKKTLIIESSFLTKWKNNDRLLVCLLFSTHLNTTASVCRRFYLVESPVVRQCEIDVTGEIAKDTNVCIICEGSASDNRPVIYRFQRELAFLIIFLSS